jgi:hypothetical protein
MLIKFKVLYFLLIKYSTFHVPIICTGKTTHANPSGRAA